MRVVDIAAIARKAKAAGAAIAVDNTFLSPALQQPIALGADFVIHSTTKYLNGHSDVVGGAVIAAEAEDAAALAAWANVTGVTGSPFDAYQTLRGIRTLFPRVESQQRNAGVVAAFLEAQPQVNAVHYPGLPSHPGHEIAKTQQRGFGAMLSFELSGGSKKFGASSTRFVSSPWPIPRRHRKPCGPSGDHDARRHGPAGKAHRRDHGHTIEVVGRA